MLLLLLLLHESGLFGLVHLFMSEHDGRTKPLLGTLMVVALHFPCKRAGERERERKGWIKSPSKGQGDLFWELKACWLEQPRGEAWWQAESTTHTDEELKGQQPQPHLHSYKRRRCSCCWHQNQTRVSLGKPVYTGQIPEGWVISGCLDVVYIFEVGLYWNRRWAQSCLF